MDFLKRITELDAVHLQERELLEARYLQQRAEMEQRQTMERDNRMVEVAAAISFEMASSTDSLVDSLLDISPAPSPTRPQAEPLELSPSPTSAQRMAPDPVSLHRPTTAPPSSTRGEVSKPADPAAAHAKVEKSDRRKRRQSGIPAPASIVSPRRTVTRSSSKDELLNEDKPPKPSGASGERPQRRKSTSDAPPKPAPQIGGESADIAYNVDKRTQRKMDSKDFKDAIEKWRGTSQAGAMEKLVNVVGNSGSINTTVVVRVRPLFPHEQERGEFDVVTCMPGSERVAGAVVHQCGEHIMAGRGMVKHLGNYVYPCQQVFDEYVESDEVYLNCGYPLLEHAVNGGVATCFMYGQTGSGKTHTMTAIQECVANDVFELIDGEEVSVWLAYFELIGKRCFDLMDNAHAEVFLKEGSDGNMHVQGAAELQVSGSQELMEKMHEALSRRETASTGANATSSRSHSVCRIRVGEGKSRGMLNLVDLAGSERKHDSMYHDAEARRSGAEINSSLMALKECIRYRALREKNPNDNVHVPYRGSSLTRVLKDSLDSPEAFTTVIATTSPCATDTEHTMGTLDTVSRLTGLDKAIMETQDEVETWAPPQVELVPPSKWNAAALQTWLAALPVKYDKCRAKVPKSMNGKQFMQLSVERLTQMMDLRSADVNMAHQLYNKIRAEAKKVQDEVDARRKQVVDDMHKKKHVQSSFKCSFAPEMK